MEEKNKRTNTNLGQLQAKKREFCDTLHSLCICRLSQACIWRETSTKASRNANSSLTIFPHCLLLTVLPHDCYLTPTGLFSVVDCISPSSFVNWPSVFSGTFLSSSTSGLVGDFEFSPLSGFRAKADKEILWQTRAHTPNTTNGHIVSHW